MRTLPVVLLLTVANLLALAKSDTISASDYRSVSYEDMLPSLEQFFDDGVGHFSELLFDFPRYQLIAGTNAIFKGQSKAGL
jgi:hypothetical protein